MIKYSIWIGKRLINNLFFQFWNQMFHHYLLRVCYLFEYIRLQLNYLYEKYGYRNKNELYREINSYFYKKYYDEYVEKFKNNPLETYLELDDLGYVNFKDLGNQIKFNSDEMVDDMAEANKLYTFLLYKFEKNPDLAGAPNEGQKDGYYLIHIFYP